MARLPMRYNRQAGVIIAFLGAGAFIYSFVLLSGTATLLRNAAPASGKIIEVAQQTKYSRGHAYYVYTPKISFTAKDGKGHTFISDSETENQSRYSIGQEINILYNTQNPADAKINSFFDIWGGFLMLAVLGLLFGLGGLGAAVFSKSEAAGT